MIDPIHIAESSLSLADEILYDLDPDHADVAPELLAKRHQLGRELLELKGQLSLPLSSAEEHAHA